MDLLPIGTGQYAVLVALEESEKCQPLDLIDELRETDKDLASAAVAFLTRILPAQGLARRPRSSQKSLSGQNRGLIQVILFQVDRLRLYLFMDGPAFIICAGADLIEENGSSTPGLEYARTVRQRYLSAKERRDIQIMPLDLQSPRGDFHVN